MHRTSRVVRLLAEILIVSAICLVFAAACGGEPDGKALVQSRCITCHGLDTVEEASKSLEEWEATVARMVSHGARLSADEQATVVQYLAERDQ